MKRIKSEVELLQPEIRAQLIQEIQGAENRIRKDLSYKRYQCYKDKTNRYVAEDLLNMFDISTVLEMRYAISNISIVRKIIDKLSRVYSNGVERSGESEAVTENIHQIEKKLDLNTAMKKTNRFLKLQKNLAFYVKPYPNEEGKIDICLEPMLPHLYDVVEGYYNRTEPMVYILSTYKPPAEIWSQIRGTNQTPTAQVTPLGNAIDEKIADQPIDQDVDNQPTYIFWSKNYHFTCNSKGEIIPDEGNPENINPFGEMPIINFAIDQDGAFWAQGGDDLVDGAILLNSMITQTNHVGVVQGYGQLVLTGENLPRAIKVGPTKAIVLEYKKDEQAIPTAEFLSANPQLQDLRGLTEAYIALLLTTNNLSTSGIAANLQGGVTAPSGVALIIDKAESLEDVQDQRQVFLDNEPKIFSVIQKILAHYGSEVCDKLAGVKLPENIEETLQIKFNEATPIMSETEKLANLKLRKDLGLDNMITLLMKDDPQLSEKQAEEKLLKLMEQELKIKLAEQKKNEELGIESPYTDPDEVDPNDPNAKPGAEDEDNQDDNNGQ